MIKDTEKPGNRKKNYTFHTYVGYQLFLKKKKKKCWLSILVTKQYA